MLRNKQHSMTAPPPWSASTRDENARIEVLTEMIDTLDLDCFLRDPAYRRRLNDALSRFSDEEFDRFERLYTRRFTIN
ncbi:MAG TPA: hypothetical protein VK196_03415 [Magnetospirillum sp.]|nr:hypothetical protein [Magnetospirillum sp.]